MGMGGGKAQGQAQALAAQPLSRLCSPKTRSFFLALLPLDSRAGRRPASERERGAGGRSRQGRAGNSQGKARSLARAPPAI